MSDVSDTVDTSLAMWNETDPTRRAAHIAHKPRQNLHYISAEIS
jgi:hypothetical protein